MVLQVITKEDAKEWLTEKWNELASAKESTEPHDRYLNKREAAKFLGVSVSTIDALRRRGKLKGEKIGKVVRFKLSEIMNSFK